MPVKNERCSTVPAVPQMPGYTLDLDIRSTDETTVVVASGDCNPPWGLTDREYEILQSLALGMRNNQIAAQLYLSKVTVTHYVSGILDKMGVDNRTQAAVAHYHYNLENALGLQNGARPPRMDGTDDWTPPVNPLTKREMEVSALVAQGYTSKYIAQLLGISERTARTHISTILSKRYLTSRTQLALWWEKEKSGAIFP